MNVLIWQVTIVACFANLACCVVVEILPKNIDVIKSLNDKGPSDLCPAKNSRIATYLPHPEDCNLFYLCENRVPYLKKCPNGLHFNTKLKACDYPETAGCDKDVVEKGKVRVGKENFDECPKKNSRFPVYLPDPDDCSRFFICDAGIPHPKKCHPGLHFNPKINACDYPKNAKCDTNADDNNKGRIADDDAGECPKENSIFPVYLPHPDDCNKFYICDNGSPILKTCFAGLHFNPKLNACDFPENVGCESGHLKVLNGRSHDDTFFLSCPDENSRDIPTVYSHPTDCDKFYECDHGIPVLKTCEPGLNFNEEMQACDKAENTVCEKEMSLAFAGVPSRFCPSVDGRVPIFFRHETNCSIYYMCSHGLAYEFVCPARLHFNLRKRICDYEENAKCKTYT